MYLIYDLRKNVKDEVYVMGKVLSVKYVRQVGQTTHIAYISNKDLNRGFIYIYV